MAVKNVFRQVNFWDQIKKSDSYFVTSSWETTSPRSTLMKLTRVFAAALGDLDPEAPPLELDTWMTFTVQPRAAPKDLRGDSQLQQCDG